MSKILCLLAPGFEEIEAVTVIDIVRRAAIDITIAGVEQDVVMGSHGVAIRCDLTFDKVQSDQFECLFLPGGQPGTSNLKDHHKVLDLIRDFNNNNRYDESITINGISPLG